MYLISLILSVLTIIIPLLIGVAFFTLAERKIISSIQRRRGPDVVGIYGLLQPIADGLKLLTKESLTPTSANSIIYFLAPIVTFLLSLLS
jgi:NADH:ubiquinone oxidoreductase subunit H